MSVWVGGSGEKVTLKLVAKYGDACNVTASNPDGYRHKFDVLKQHCDNVGRDYDTILKTSHIFMTLLEPGQDPEKATQKYRERRNNVSLEEFRNYAFVGTPPEMVDHLSSLADAGVEYFVIYFYNDLTRLDVLEQFAQDVMPTFRR